MVLTKGSHLMHLCAVDGSPRRGREIPIKPIVSPVYAP